MLIQILRICRVCQQFEFLQRFSPLCYNKGKLATQLNELVFMKFIGPPICRSKVSSTQTHYKYLAVMVDKLFNLALVLPIKDASTNTTLSCLTIQIDTHWSCKYVGYTLNSLLCLSTWLLFYIIATYSVFVTSSQPLHKQLG